VDRPLLFLIGYRGTGKTTVAKALAARLGWQSMDADEELERRHGPVCAIFEHDGEAVFRDHETAVLTELARLERHVIATGGGVILRPENRVLLTRMGRTVWLTADVPTLWQRIHADPRSTDRRPALTVGGIEEIVEVLRAREALYRECADLIVSTQERTPEQVIDELMVGLQRFTAEKDRRQ
jgi:shikimate kinase